MNNEIVVSIACNTYNHEKYIIDTFEGFFKQITNFRFEIIVCDDASKDNTVDIINSYSDKAPDLIKPIFLKENVYSKGRKPLLECILPVCQGKYIALCEGDDYWTDPYKLQKQFNFLEKKQDYNLCCHRYSILHQQNNSWEQDYGHHLFKEGIKGITFDNKLNFEVWLTKTMTVMFRRNCFETSILKQYKYLRDVHLFYHLLKNSKGYCFNFNGAVYRKHDVGIHTRNSLIKKFEISDKVFYELLIKNKDDMPLKHIMEVQKSNLLNHYFKNETPILKRYLFLLKYSLFIHNYKVFIKFLWKDIKIKWSK